jgi:hypothetical protein
MIPGMRLSLVLAAALVAAGGALAANPQQVSLDMDGDRRPDRAELRAAPGEEYYELVITLSSKPKVEHRLYPGPLNRLPVMGLTRVAPGRHATLCSKGYADCGPDEPKSVVLAHDGLDFYLEESANSYVYWDGKAFQRVWISD